MTPRTKKRPSIFPQYAPPDHENPSIEEFGAHIGEYMQTLAKRVVQIGAILVTVGSGGAYATHLNETRPTVAESARIKALEDSVSVNRKRISDLELLINRNIYISCQVLAKVQPAQSIVPQECSR